MTLHEEIEVQSVKYAEILNAFLSQHNLSGRIDHAAIKVANTHDYEKFIEDLLPRAESINYIEINSRRIAVAKLFTPLKIGNLGETDYLEILEPRPEKAGKDIVGFEHTEIVYKDLSTLQQVFKSKNQDFEFEDNGHHQAVVVKLDNKGHEVKFTAKGIAQIQEEENRQGLLITLK